jgi:hypothetical protein
MATRTHTRYFDDESLEPLVAEVERLAADWDQRRPHVGERLAVAGDMRIAILRAALVLLAEPVAEALY